jgi:small subunit ribosomal protein S6
MRTYELTLIFKPDLKEEEQDKIIGGLKKVVEGKKGRPGKVVSAKLWGRKPLAYQIKKQKEGIYHLVAFEIEPQVLEELEKKIKLEEDIIRHLIVRLG